MGKYKVIYEMDGKYYKANTGFFKSREEAEQWSQNVLPRLHGPIQTWVVPIGQRNPSGGDRNT